MPVKTPKFQKGDTIAERVGRDGIGRHAIVTSTGVMSNNQVFLHLRYDDGSRHNSAQQDDFVLVSRAVELDGSYSSPVESPLSTRAARGRDEAAYVLSEISRHVAHRARIDSEITLAVARARRFNASWAELGAHLGVSGQAAGQKYGAKP